MYARLQLPDEWKVPGANYTVTKAHLYVDHGITNNPNDQLRPDDLENEAATGRKPSYRIEGTPGTDTEVWKSTVPCYEGDGDTIDTEEGFIDPTFIDVGTVLRNMPYALDPAAEPGLERADDPYALSSDLKGAFTNAFYTSTNRDPFEWSYRPLDSAADTFNFIGCAGPVDDPAYAGTCEDDYDNPYTNVGNLALVSGPRWRLKPNKFGQDLPGLEIPLAECSPPPFEKENIKYNVGVPTTTVINLLDWDEETKGPSPLATSRGWVDVTSNNFVEVAGVNSKGVPYTTNGLPMTKDFNLAVYIKGDRKAVGIYNARLEIDYVPASTTDYDLELEDLTVIPAAADRGDPGTWSVTVHNYGPADVVGATLTVDGVTDRNWSYGPWTVNFNLAANSSRTLTDDWSTNVNQPLTIDWTATVDGPGDTDPTNNEQTVTTTVN